MLFFFPLDVLDEIWDLIESVSEGFLTYTYSSDLPCRRFRSSVVRVFLPVGWLKNHLSGKELAPRL